MKSTRFPFRIILFSLIGLIIILAVAGAVLSKLAFRKLEARLHAAGIKMHALNVNLITRSITVTDFEWHTRNATGSPASKSTTSATADSSFETSRYTSVRIETIRASGINVLAFVRKKQIQLGSLLLSGGQITVDVPEFHRDKKNTTGELPFLRVAIDDLAIEDMAIVMKNDSIVEHMANLSLQLRDVGLSESARFADPQAYTLGGIEMSVDNYHMTAQRSMYTLSVKRIVLDSRSKELVIDSVVLLPRYGKYEFSRRLGKQVDRFVLHVPQVTISGLDFNRLRDSIVVASSLRIADGNLHVFRDKRLPFIKHHSTPLPVAYIRTLPFGFALDSLILADTKITYEEFPEKGFETGYIVFDQLQARVDRISNRDLYPGIKRSVLHVVSRVMQNGVIKVDFTLPYDKAQVYNAKGRISNLALHRLNPILESLAFIRVESGRLNALDFDFDYNDFASNGKLMINYENLKLAGLTKEKESRENEVKSLALGLFVRKDKNRELPIEKRTGKIYYERDRRRAIFNVWVKSLFSGVKSSVMDSPAARKPLTRKERRDSLRNVRKETREKQKKERS